MTHSKKSFHRKHPITPRALRKEVLRYLANQDGSTKHSDIFTHFALDPVETVQEALDALFEEHLLDEQWDGVIVLAEKGKKALDRLHALEKR